MPRKVRKVAMSGEDEIVWESVKLKPLLGSRTEGGIPADI